MAKEIVILYYFNGNTDGQGSTNIRVTGVAWFPVTSGQEIVLAAGTVSRWTGASGPENTAIQTGTVVEEYFEVQYASGTTAATMKADLQSKWTARKSQRDALPNPKQYYGVNWDGTNWSA
jgi:hypothetical protein